jgi:hypothetical protein
VNHRFGGNHALAENATTQRTTATVVRAASLAAKAGPTPDTLELVQLIYGVAALAAQPPMRAVVSELGVPERTATHWITKARQAGLLNGITYAVGRQPDGHSRTPWPPE